jgi:hypothetical protein
VSDGPPVESPDQPPYIPPTVNATLTEHVASDNGDGTLLLGQDATITGTLDSSGGDGPVYVYARQVDAYGDYGSAYTLGQATPVDTGTKDALGYEIYDWSLSAATANLGAGVYDIEAFMV